VPVYHPKRFIRIETLRSITPKCLLALLKPHRSFLAENGLELPAAKKHSATIDLQKLSHILATPDFHHPPDLADALYYIHEMATPEGMDALLPELNGGQFTFGADEYGPADVAVQAWVKDRSLVERKHAEIFASRPRRFEYFQSRTDPPPKLPALTPERLAPLEAYLNSVFVSKGRGQCAKVLTYPHGDDCLFIVRHGDPHRREGALDGAVETSVVYRPLKFDVVGYDAASGALRVYTRTKWERSLYRNAFGQFLFGALDHFPDCSRYTLEPLRSGDRACLACADAPPIKLINLTELHLRWGGIYAALEIHQAGDVFGALRHRKVEVPAGPRIELASFDVYLFGHTRPQRVTIVPPNIARYSHEGDSPLIEQWLGLRGFICKPNKVDDGRQEAFPILQGG
jgi:hypothetical protein